MKWKIRSQLNPGRLFGIVIHQPRSQSTSRTAVPPVISTAFPAFWLAVSNILFFFLIDCWHNLDFFFSFVSLSIKMQKLSKYPQSCLSPFSGAGSDEVSFSLWLICCTLWKTIAHKLWINSPIPPHPSPTQKNFRQHFRPRNLHKYSKEVTLIPLHANTHVSFSRKQTLMKLEFKLVFLNFWIYPLFFNCLERIVSGK